MHNLLSSKDLNLALISSRYRIFSISNNMWKNNISGILKARIISWVMMVWLTSFNWDWMSSSSLRIYKWTCSRIYSHLRVFNSRANLPDQCLICCLFNNSSSKQHINTLNNMVRLRFLSNLHNSNRLLLGNQEVESSFPRLSSNRPRRSGVHPNSSLSRPTSL